MVTGRNLCGKLFCLQDRHVYWDISQPLTPHYILYRTTYILIYYRLNLLTTWASCSQVLQYSSQIVETDTVSPEFSGTIMRFLLHTVFPPEMCLLPPQCWATRTLKHSDHCDTQINIGEGEIDTSVSRFLTSIVFSLKRGKSNIFSSRRIFGSSIQSICLVRAQMRKINVGCRIIFQLN